MKVCVAATKLSIFRCVAYAAHFFIYGGMSVKSHFTFHRHIDGAGRIVIPRDARQAVGLTAGDAVVIRVTDEGILLSPADKK